MNGAQTRCDAIIFKILLIGDSGVGKTCLMFRFTDDTFSESFVATIGIDFKIKNITARDNQLVKLQLWDTAGQEKFFTITRPYYRNAHCVLLIYDVTKASSFENVKRWMNNIDNNAPDDVIKVLVANKSDLTERRVVKRSDGERLAAFYCVQYFETSAKTSENVYQMFSSITNTLVESKRQSSNSASALTAVESDKVLLDSNKKWQHQSDVERIKESVGNCCSM
ncbi:hypothetical protein GJ496_002269 [Pomphorhynchus laevis]|nr:hypothetical protein GJ496_002269 [Pomphorhynchus laevis]